VVCGFAFIQRQKQDSWTQSPCIRNAFFQSLNQQDQPTIAFDASACYSTALSEQPRAPLVLDSSIDIYTIDASANGSAAAAAAAAADDALSGSELEQYLKKKSKSKSALTYSKLRSTGVEIAASITTPSAAAAAKKPKKPKYEVDQFLMDFGVFYANDSARIASSSSGLSGLVALNQTLQEKKKPSKYDLFPSK
jgi:hypothetical protein